MRGLLIAPTAADDEVADRGWDPARRYQLDPQVALRPEPFGALAYHYGSRRLTFLRSPLLVEVVRDLGRHGSVVDAVDALVPATQRRVFLTALASLASSSFIRSAGEDPDAHR